ncbi:MAG: proline dehydrogenase family protein [Bryobacteraceae bacterium]
MRRLFLYLSRHRRLRRWMERSPVARRVSARFIAGPDLSDALAVARRVCDEGLRTTLDPLGENVTTLEEAAACRDEAVAALRGLAAAGLEPNVSIKLTQFGLDLDERVCEDNVRRLEAAAAAVEGFIRVDMESSVYTERTLRLVGGLDPARAGVVIQAYLRRSERDVEALCDRGVRARLCKGAYLEPDLVVYAEKRDVDRSYVRLMHTLLERGRYPALATHDEAILAEAIRFARARGIAPDRFEFQMLYGIRRDLQRRLTSQGWRVRLYVPYGKAWYPYFMRRLAERPANAVFLLRNLWR